MVNHLAGESSPYLLSHSSNPVNWYPWGPDALARAALEDKPIFLSVGYSACHWCHVMERESFTDQSTADLLNAHFISIKVDREERPDLDAIYMNAVSMMTGSGGWPLSVWLTPDGAPFYGGTYFPDKPRFGMPSFRQLLEALADAWINRRNELLATAGTIVEHLSRETGGSKPSRSAGLKVLGPDTTKSEAALLHQQARDRLTESFDPVYGGWGDAPKFPQPAVIEYLLLRHSLRPDPATLSQVELTLDAMACGGIYDQLGGGFHRYSTDREWLVPHFEKMLYDNAQLARCYLHAWQLSGRGLYRRVAEETLDYILREMRHPLGGFYSSQDADSEGEEGKFFLWTSAEINRVLGPADAALACETLGVTAEGNFDGRNILRVVREGDRPGDNALPATIRSRLREAREERLPPGRDEKVLASWNGLTLSAMAEAARALGSAEYRQAALSLAEFLCGELVSSEYRVSHSWKDGRVSDSGFLEDHTHVVDGLLALYQTTFDEHWLTCAHRLTDAMIARFRREAGGFYDTGSDHEVLISRPRSLQDAPTPSGNSMAATNLLRIAAYLGNNAYWSLAEETLDSVGSVCAQAPMAFGHWLSAHMLATEGMREVAIVGEAGSTDMEALLAAVFDSYRPDLVVAARSSDRPSGIPLLTGREHLKTDSNARTRAVAWLCRRATCGPPTADPNELRRLLNALPPDRAISTKP